MVKPNVYVRGGRPEIVITTTDTDGNPFIPLEARLSVEEPDGTVITYSGGDMFMGTASGYLYVDYRPPTRGWYQYDTWVKDGYGREDTDRNGFEVVEGIF